MRPPWLELLDDTTRACVDHDRPDLAERLRERRAGLSVAARRVVVFGCAGQGKSQLVNALVNAPVCAVGDDVTTAVPAVVRHAEAPTAVVVGPDRRALGAGTGVAVPVESVESATARANKLAMTSRDVVCAEIGLPRSLLGAGLVLVDAPPVGDPASPRTGRAMAALAEADAALLVTDATTAIGEPELDLLGQVARLCPTTAVVLTKIDLVPRWRRVAELDRRRLAEAGLPVPLVPVSSALRLAAARTGDKALNAESGFTDLVTRLRDDVLADPGGVVSRAAAATCLLALDELIDPVRTRAAAIPAAVAQDEWIAAGRRVEHLQREAARWQTRLADEVADLAADVEYDLRERTRRVLREVDDYFEVADPARVWPEFSEWMRESLTAVAEVNSDWLLRRFEWIAAGVAREAAPEAGELPATLVRELVPGAVDDLREPNVERFSPAQKLFVGLRGSYSGLLMSGLATTLAGLPLINPISLGAGAAFGARSVFEERGSRLKRRQAVAKTTAQRHVDDFFLAYGKQTKDAIRVIHRALRDSFAEVGLRLRAEATEAARQVKRELDAAATRRAEQVALVRRELTRLVGLRERAEALRGPARAGAPRGLTA